MNKSRINKKVISVFGLLVVLFVIIVAFIYRSEIEEYAMTGYFGVFVACFAANATILLPAPGIFVVIQYSQFLNPIFIVILGGFGTSLGEMIGYLLGRSGKEVINFNTENKILIWFSKKPYFTVFAFSVIPLPLFDIVGIAAGMTKVNSLLFWLTCFAGKVLKMTVYVALYAYVKELFLSFI